MADKQPDEFHPAIREALDQIRTLEDEQIALEQRIADAYLALGELAGSDRRVARFLGLSATAGRNRMEQARRNRWEREHPGETYVRQPRRPVR